MATQKQSRFEVDQSIRIKEINRDTIIGIANKKQSFTLLLPRKIKRHFREDFRLQGRPRQFAPTLFAAGIALLLRQFKIIPTGLVIDTEYSSHESLITEFIQNLYPNMVIEIKRVGKNSPAHEAAYWTYRGRNKPDMKATQAGLHSILYKKTTGERHHLEFTRIHLSNRPVNKKYTKKRRKSK